MKTTEIQESLLHEYLRLRPFAITNYTGITGFEADLIMINSSRSSYEYEIKTSRSDFLKDFNKKAKHSALSKPVLKRGHGYPLAPNYFYYVCEEGLIKPSEIPKYAGLIYIVDGVPKVITKGIKLHKHKVPDRLMINLCRTLSSRLHYGCAYQKYKYEPKG